MNIMRKLKLTQYAEDELNNSAMNKLKGGTDKSSGCQSPGCGSDNNVNLNKTTVVMKTPPPPLDPIVLPPDTTTVERKDTIATDTIITKKP